MEYRKGILFILIITAIVLNIFFIITENSANDFCLTGHGCKIVQNSEYATLLGGLKNSHIGLIAFVCLFLIYLFVYNKRASYKLFLIFSYIGAATAITFLALQAFAIGAYCSNCIIIDVLMIIIAGIATSNYAKEENNPSKK